MFKFAQKHQNQINPDELSFETPNYAMKKEYFANKLVVASLARIPSEEAEEGYRPKNKTTSQKYIFEIKKNDKGKIYYQEIFTGFKASSEPLQLDLPFVEEPILFIDYFPETTNEKIPYLDLLWKLDDLRTNKKEKELVK